MDESDIRPPTLMAMPSFLAGNVARVGHRMLLEALATHELRLAHFAVLAALSDFGPLHQYELAERLDINRSHLVGYVDHVEEHGLVLRERDPHDRRRQRVALTPDGRALLRSLQVVAERSQAKFLEVLTAAERQTLITLLGRVLRASDQTRLAAQPRP